MKTKIYNYISRSSFLIIFLLFSILNISCGQNKISNQTKSDKIDKLVSLYSGYEGFNGSILVAHEGKLKWYFQVFWNCKYL